MSWYTFRKMVVKITGKPDKESDTLGVGDQRPSADEQGVAAAPIFESAVMSSTMHLTGVSHGLLPKLC